MVRACINNQIEIVKLLLAHGVDVNVQNDQGEMALHRAARDGSIELVYLLLEAGADVQAKDAIKNKPLDYALGSRHMQIAELLIAHGADEQAKKGVDWFIAIKNNDIIQVTTWLAQGVDPNNKDRYGDGTALHLAAQLGFFEIVKLLLAHNVDVNAKDDFGNMPLYYAAEKNFVTIGKLLMSNGAGNRCKK